MLILDVKSGNGLFAVFTTAGTKKNQRISNKNKGKPVPKPNVVNDNFWRLFLQTGRAVFDVEALWKHQFDSLTW